MHPFHQARIEQQKREHGALLAILRAAHRRGTLIPANLAIAAATGIPRSTVGLRLWQMRRDGWYGRAKPPVARLTRYRRAKTRAPMRSHAWVVTWVKDGAA